MPMPKLKVQTHADAAENLYVEKELEHLIPEMFEVEFEATSARGLLPVNNVPAGADEVVWHQLKKTGLARFVANYADDIPMSDAFIEEFKAKMKSIAAAFDITIQDVNAGMMTGKSIEPIRSQAAMEAYLQLEDEVLWLGYAHFGFKGLANLANAVTYTVPADGTGSSTLWTTKTKLLIARDIFGLEHAVYEATKQRETPKRLVLPLSRKPIFNEPLQSGSDTTLAKYVLDNASFLKEMVFSTRVETAGAGSTKRMIAYDPNKSKLQALISDPSPLPPQAKNLTTRVPIHGRCGGVIAPKPMSVGYGDNI